jgi:hypothetical protein
MDYEGLYKKSNNEEMQISYGEPSSHGALIWAGKFHSFKVVDLPTDDVLSEFDENGTIVYLIASHLPRNLTQAYQCLTQTETLIKHLDPSYLPERFVQQDRLWGTNNVCNARIVTDTRYDTGEEE